MHIITIKYIQNHTSSINCLHMLSHTHLTHSQSKFNDSLYVTVWQMYFKIIILSEILTITCRFPNALKLFVSKLVGS